jgi:hypothetical protein
VGAWYAYSDLPDWEPTFYGLAGDEPVPGAYTGEVSHAGFAYRSYSVYRPSTGAWYVDGELDPTYFGLPGDIPLVRPPTPTR